MSSGGYTFLYGVHSVHVAVAEFHDSVINLSYYYYLLLFY